MVKAQFERELKKRKPIIASESDLQSSRRLVLLLGVERGGGRVEDWGGGRGVLVTEDTRDRQEAKMPSSPPTSTMLCLTYSRFS